MTLFDTRLEMLKSLVPPNSVICEIGVWKGQFADQLLSLQPRQLILIDPFEGHVSSGDENGNRVETAYLPIQYLLMTQKYKNNPLVTLLRGYSYELLPLLANGSVDVIYIDGDHSYQGVKNDLAIARQLVRKGGLICGHDYEMNPNKTGNNYNFGVKQAVDEFCQQHGLTICAKGLDGQISYTIRND